MKRESDFDEALIERLEKADEIPQLAQIIRAFGKGLGFEHSLYGYRMPRPATQPRQFIVNGYPRAWREYYDAQGFMLIDPVIRRGEETSVPFAWDDLERDLKQQELFRAATEHGVAHGMSCPVHGRHGEVSLLNVARRAPLPRDAGDRRALLSKLLVFCVNLHDNFRRVLVDEDTDRPMTVAGLDVLTARQLEVLRLAADGLTDDGIAAELKLTVRTVRFHLEETYLRIGAKNRSSAISRGLALGLIATQVYHPQLARPETFFEIAGVN